MKRIVSTPDAPASSLYSQGVAVGPILYVSGMTGTDVRTGQLEGSSIQEQTRRALHNGLAVVEAAGGALADIVQVTVLLARAEDLTGMNEAYAAFFPIDPPTRAVTKLGVELPNVLVSIMMTAHVDA